MRHLVLISLFTGLTLAAVVPTVHGTEATLSPKEQLGKALFFDPALSSTGTQSCAACHGPECGMGVCFRAQRSNGGS